MHVLDPRCRANYESLRTWEIGAGIPAHTITVDVRSYRHSSLGGSIFSLACTVHSQTCACAARSRMLASIVRLGSGTILLTMIGLWVDGLVKPVILIRHALGEAMQAIEYWTEGQDAGRDIVEVVKNISDLQNPF